MYQSSTCIYSSLLLCREYEKLFVELVYEDLVGIYKKTGCLKPCHYMKYRIEGDRQTTSYQSPDFLFTLNSISNDTFVEREELVYPWTALVADFGGSISLFLGLSFMSVWDGVHYVRAGLRMIQSRVGQRECQERRTSRGVGTIPCGGP